MSRTDGPSVIENPRAHCPGHPGVAVVLGDGRTWTLPFALKSPEIRAERDRFADAAWTGGKYLAADVQGIALALLTAAYDEPADVIARAILTATPNNLLEAVVDATVITSLNDERKPRTYSDWMISGLLAAGLDPKKIPDDQLESVLKHLVGTGRIVPPEHFFSAAIGVRVRSALLGSLDG